MRVDDISDPNAWTTNVFGQIDGVWLLHSVSLEQVEQCGWCPFSDSENYCRYYAIAFNSVHDFSQWIEEPTPATSWFSQVATRDHPTSWQISGVSNCSGFNHVPKPHLVTGGVSLHSYLTRRVSFLSHKGPYRDHENSSSSQRKFFLVRDAQGCQKLCCSVPWLSTYEIWDQEAGWTPLSSACPFPALGGSLPRFHHWLATILGLYNNIGSGR